MALVIVSPAEDHSGNLPTIAGPASHVGKGVFYRGSTYTPIDPPQPDTYTQLDVEMFVARGGDGNADTKVDTVDITNLVANFGLADRDWTHNDTAGGDGRGDGKVDTLDIIDLVANFDPPSPDPGPGPECSAVAEYNPTAGEITAIPEPSTLVLLTIGAVGLLAYAWRRNRKAA